MDKILNKRIEEAAMRNATCRFYDDDDEILDISVKSFEDGARWRINSVWHDRAEKADTSKKLILMYSNGSVRVTLLNPNLTFDGFLSVDMFIKWAYVSDILPERKEETE